MKFERFQQLVRMMFLPDAAGNIRTRYEHVDAAQIHPLVLAYIGDAYFHLYVRMRLLSYEQTQVQALHAFSAQIVSALWQARAYRGISDMLTEEEQTIYRRARNTHRAARPSRTIMRVRALRHCLGAFTSVRRWSALRRSRRRHFRLSQKK